MIVSVSAGGAFAQRELGTVSASYFAPQNLKDRPSNTIQAYYASDKTILLLGNSTSCIPYYTVRGSIQALLVFVLVIIKGQIEQKYSVGVDPLDCH